MSWFSIAEKFLPSTRSKLIAAATIAVTATVYVGYKELPSSWLATSQSEAFLWRLVVTLTVALTGVSATLISVVADYRVSSAENQAKKNAANISRQKAIDDLAEELSWAIRNLLNKSVSSDFEVSEWEKNYRDWCKRISEKLDNRFFFTRADQLHFDMLGMVPSTNFSGNFNKQHKWLVSQLNLKFERLRDIIGRSQMRKR